MKSQEVYPLLTLPVNSSITTHKIVDAYGLQDERKIGTEAGGDLITLLPFCMSACIMDANW